MIKTAIILIGAALASFGWPQEEGSIHVVYSKMLSEVRPPQSKPRSGVAYVYPITATDPPFVTDYETLKSSEFSVSQEIDSSAVQKTQSFSREISAAPKKLPSKGILVSKQQLKERIAPYLSIDPLDPKANEFGTN